MNRDLHEKIGSFEYEKLFAGLEPRAMVHGGVIRKLGEEGTLKRGTLLAKSDKDHKLVIFGTAADEGETLTPDCVLTDDIVVGTTADENTVVYISGCFNEAALIVSNDATLSEADRDALRMKGIVLGTVMDP